MGELYNPYPKLPKNIRQIGERDPIVKLYVEDYVNTYLKRLYPTGGQDLRVGLLLGTSEDCDGVPHIFIDGALEMEGVTGDGEKVVFYEGAWKKAYQDIERMFPKRTVQGWFLCGAQGSQLSPLNYWQQHGQYFSGDHKLMYLNSGLENEEAVYMTSEDGFYKLRGHHIYYERNQMMQDYMILRREARRVDGETDNKVIHSFRQKMESRKVEAAAEKSTVGILGTVCAALAVTVLAGGVTMVNNYRKMKEMETVIASVLPTGKVEAEKRLSGEEPEVIIQEGNKKSEIVWETMEESGEPRQDGKEVFQGEESGQGQNFRGSEGKTEETAGTENTGVELTGKTEVGTESSAEEETNAQAAAIHESTARQTIYEVQEGETLYSICLEKYQSLSMMDEICRLNGLDDKNKIKIGQKLIMP